MKVTHDGRTVEVTTQHVKGRSPGYGAAVVLVDGVPVGHITRPPAKAVRKELRASGCVTANQPWRAYLGSGRGVKLVGVYHRQDGGKDAAAVALAGAYLAAVAAQTEPYE